MYLEKLIHKDFLKSSAVFLFVPLVTLLIYFSSVIISNIFIAVALVILLMISLFFLFKPFWCIFAFGIFLIFQPIIVGFSRLPIMRNMDEVLIITFFLLTVIKRLILKKPFLGTELGFPLLCWIIMGIISSIYNRTVPPYINFGGFILAIKGFLLFYIFANNDFEKEKLTVFIKGFLVVGLLLAIYAILGIIFPSVFLKSLGFAPHISKYGFPAAESLLGHPGAFAAFMGILTCYSFSALINSYSNKRYLLLTIFFVICIILSFRRTTLLGVLLAFAIAIIFKSHLNKRIIRLRSKIFIFSIAIFLIFGSFIVSMYKDLIRNYLESGDTPRSLLFKAGIQIAKDYFPLGTGFGSFSSGINRFYYSPLYYNYKLSRVWGLTPENQSFTNDTFWPHVLAETGFLGFICYILVVVCLFNICNKALNNLKDGAVFKMFAFGVFMVLILSLIETTKATFYEMSLWTYFYFGGVGILVSIMGNRINKGAPDNES